MLLIVTPLSGWRREVQVFKFTDDSHWEAFEALHERYEEHVRAGALSITLVPISEDQVGVWLENNFTPGLVDRLLRRVRWVVNTVSREAS